MSEPHSWRQGGFSLVEVIIFLVIMAIALTAVLQAFWLAGSRGATLLVQPQAVAAAQGLLEEMLARAFANPPGGYAGGPHAANRHLFDDVSDYDGLIMNGLRDPYGQPMAGLERYQLEVEVLPWAWAGLGAAQGRLLRVRLSDPAGQAWRFEAFKAAG